MSITKTREVFSLPNVHYAEKPYRMGGFEWWLCTIQDLIL